MKNTEKDESQKMQRERDLFLLIKLLTIQERIGFI